MKKRGARRRVAKFLAFSTKTNKHQHNEVDITYVYYTYLLSVVLVVAQCAFLPLADLWEQNWFNEMAN